MSKKYNELFDISKFQPSPITIDILEELAKERTVDELINDENDFF
jgi:hypothetical protein